jgi:hypothetical protein
MPKYEVTAGVNVREYHKIEVEADTPEAALLAARKTFEEGGISEFTLCDEQMWPECSDPDFNAFEAEVVGEDDGEDEDDFNVTESHCPECWEYESECLCAELDAAEAQFAREHGPVVPHD